MNIGISSPIEVFSLKAHLDGLSDFDLSLGLGGTAVNILIDGLIREGNNVIVFTLDPRIKDRYELSGKKLKIIFGHFRLLSKKKTFDFCYREIVQIRSFIREEERNLDVVNAHWSYEFAIGALLANRDKTVVTFRDDAPSILRILKHPYRATRLLMDRWVRWKGKYFTYNSPYLAKLINIGGAVIENPIFDGNVKQNRKYPGYNHLFRICFVSNGADSRKNPHVAVRAFQLLKEKTGNAELSFIGKGYGIEEDFARQYRDVQGLEFIGSLPHRNFLESLNGFDLMLHTSKEESFGNNLIEAMANGLPVVAGKHSGAVPWVLDYGNAGLLVDINAPEDIAEALFELITNPQLYERYSKAGFANVGKRFSQKVVTKKYEEEYKKLAGLL